jgi:hypothetical protein
MRRALGLAEEATLRVTWVITNASLTEFRYRDEELSLVGFNHQPFIRDRKLITYR